MNTHSDEYRELQDLRKQIERVERELSDLKAREDAAFWKWVAPGFRLGFRRPKSAAVGAAG